MAEMQFDRLKMYFGEPFDVGNGMQVLTPSINDIIHLPNSDLSFYQTLYIWVGNPTMYRLMLWDIGIDWNKISDYQLFTTLLRGGNTEASKLLFGDIDFTTFEQYDLTSFEPDEEGNNVEKHSLTLFSPEYDIEISEKDYTLISSYLKAAYNIYPKVEKAKGRVTKEAIIEEDRMNLEIKKQKGDDKQESTLLPLISACVNHPGFKYNLDELRNVNMIFFMDCVQRLQIYESSTALLKGAYSGFCDTSKINKDELNFMRSISNK